ncbi:NAD(P)-dependent oxidoreductase [Rhizobium ruizarguesonis]
MSIAGHATVLGCGLMGSALVRTLHSRDQKVVGWNRSPSRLVPLANAGVATFTDISAALDGCSTVIAVLSSYDAVRRALDAEMLAGKVLINLTSGSVQDAIDMSAWATECGVGYLDGSIWVLPSMIGAPETVISCAGSSELWLDVEPLVKILGGSSFHAGLPIENGNVLEACFPGAFYMTAQFCFLESVLRARRSGIGADVIAQSVAPSLRLLETSLVDLASRFISNDQAAGEATLDVWLNAAEAYDATTGSSGLPSPFLDILLAQLRTARSAGLGPFGPSAMLGLLEKADPTKD